MTARQALKVKKVDLGDSFGFEPEESRHHFLVKHLRRLLLVVNRDAHQYGMHRGPPLSGGNANPRDLESA